MQSSGSGRFSELFALCPMAISITTVKDGRFIEVNDHFLRRFGFTREEVMGKTAHELNMWQELESRPDLVRALKERPLGKWEHTYRARSGEIRHVIAWGQVIEAQDEPCLLAFSEDITDAKLAQSEREELLAREHAAREEAEKANRAKDDFLAMVSHELRTPLSAILGWSRLLVTGKLDAKTADRAIDAILRNATAQAQLIEDLLDVSRIASGKLTLEVKEVNVQTMANAAADALRPAAEAKSIELAVSIDTTLQTISGDQNRLQQIVWNLLANAIKFTPERGRVTLDVRRQRNDLVLIVSDSGRGIPPEFLPFIFDRFRQGEAAGSKRSAGLGLGLAIVKQLVNLHNGTVEAWSAGEGLGATFTIRLPLVATRVLQNVRIVVIEDDEDLRHLVTSVLECEGANVRPCALAEEGFQALDQWKPDLILSDLAMPGEDGVSFIRRVRMLHAADGGDTPAVALTAFSRVEDRVRALSAGFDMFVPKPVEPDELVALIAGLLSGRRGARSTSNSAM